MKSLISTVWLISISTLISISLTSQATAQNFYAGLSAGSTNFEGSQFGDSDTAWSAQLGVDLGRYFGIELAYTDYQEFDSRLSGQTSPDPVSISLSALLKYPLTNRFNLVGKIGWARLDTDIDSSNPFFNGSLNEDNLLIGLGLEYILSSQWRTRLSYEGTKMNLGTIPAGSFFSRSEGNLEYLSAGLIWDF